MLCNMPIWISPVSNSIECQLNMERTKKKLADDKNKIFFLINIKKNNRINEQECIMSGGKKDANK